MVIILKIIVKTDYKCYTLVVYIINVVKNLIIIKETKILMKNKKLTLTCGIILVICASLSIVGAFSVVTQTVNTLLWTPIEREGYNTFITWTILEAVYALVINIAQAIVYMIFGVKLIKNSKTDSDATQNKTKIITLIVLVGCSLIFDSNVAMKFIYVALIPLLSCALAYETKNVQVLEEKVISLYGTNKNGKDLGGVDLDEFGNVRPDSKVAVMEDGMVVIKQASELGNATQNNLADVKVGSNSQEQAKLAMLNELKNNGIISSEEYQKYLNRISGVSNENTSLETKAEPSQNETKNNLDVATKKTVSRKKTTKDNDTKNKKETTKNVTKKIPVKDLTDLSDSNKNNKAKKSQNTNINMDKEWKIWKRKKHYLQHREYSKLF